MKILIILFLSFNAIGSIIPLNNLKISKNVKSNINEMKFNQLIDSVVLAYNDEIPSYGAKEFIVNRFWEDERVNASSGKKNGNFILNIYGGLARFSPVTEDAFKLILCHEMGHLIGGAPTWKPFNDASSEGQADYFATLKCFRRIHLNSTIQKPTIRIHPTALVKCDQYHQSDFDKNLCYKSTLAQESLSRTIKELANLADLPDFDTKDPYVRMFTIFNGYPNPQCRLDTMFAGSLCSNDIFEKMDLNLYNKGNCHSFKSDPIDTLRPKCWYVEREDH